MGRIRNIESKVHLDAAFSVLCNTVREWIMQVLNTPQTHHLIQDITVPIVLSMKLGGHIPYMQSNMKMLMF